MRSFVRYLPPYFCGPGCRRGRKVFRTVSCILEMVRDPNKGFCRTLTTRIAGLQDVSSLRTCFATHPISSLPLFFQYLIVFSSSHASRFSLLFSRRSAPLSHRTSSFISQFPYLFLTEYRLIPGSSFLPRLFSIFDHVYSIFFNVYTKI